MNPTLARSVNWSAVNEFVQPHLDRVGGYFPTVGSPEWCALADDDPAKIAAVLNAGQHWALHLELAQQARCDASKAISAAEDWGTVSRQIQQRREFYAEKPWLRRSA
ncbi:DUF2742 domain-containing protein [Mycobacterium bourgelatii]|uniref:DUF2742 domain-containing protein n=1 Tax=Mycobacterium bourgelatii TaxID=1273442 RepID=A0A7I9YLH3_MYCBU|nr:DUF2742 domain-containing protein [Mycobacterium bourgelatii]MCV6977987.1 DUF2742 domain-containing protein [Mycobacterium bourgelatii]GFG89402.1 hypothetical protein MBOU_14440 [Mycobacterium bourgelatii]